MEQSQQIQIFINCEKKNIRMLEKIKGGEATPTPSGECGDIDNDEECKAFIERCPRLYSSISSGMVDIDKLIELKKRFLYEYTNKSGSHKEKKFHADTNIGQEIARLYYYPQINKKPTYKDLKRANEQLKKAMNK